jgi:RNA polymerase sigma-70 factor (ECF subfamily)
VTQSSDQIFRREAGRMVAALTRVFGMDNLSLAEDVVQDAFVSALEVWKFRGIPENPSAWLMTAAKNRAISVLRRRRTAQSYESELSWYLQSEWTLTPAVEELFSPSAIKDDLLRMMFSCCHAQLSEEAQVSLILNILCGFSIEEVAQAFLSAHDAAQKRIVRAKGVLAKSKRLFDVKSEKEFVARLPTVQRALYLLFNEGYHGASSDAPVRRELCSEAMHLAALLLSHPAAATPTSHALAALMCLHAARLPARMDSSGDLVSLSNHDRSRWDQELISDGLKLLELAASGNELSEYHIEAAIAAIHAQADSMNATDWGEIVRLYDTLMALTPSPIVALNRAIAISQNEGPERGLKEIDAIVHGEWLESYPFYAAARGELELRCGQPEVAYRQFQKALSVARNDTERRFFGARLRQCEKADELRAYLEIFWDDAVSNYRDAAESRHWRA